MMMTDSCCLSPRPGDPFAVHRRDGWAVHTVCLSCRSKRRETPFYDTRDEAMRAYSSVIPSHDPRDAQQKVIG